MEREARAKAIMEWKTFIFYVLAVFEISCRGKKGASIAL